VHQVLTVKLRLGDRAQPVDSADMHKYESIFVESLSESKHEAFEVLFQDNSFLDDFAPEVNMILVEPR
jgi:hypothetical protein